MITIGDLEINHTFKSKSHPSVLLITITEIDPDFNDAQLMFETIAGSNKGNWFERKSLDDIISNLDTGVYYDYVKTEPLLTIFTKPDVEFIEQALNSYWHQSHQALNESKFQLGDLEKKSHEQIMAMSKLLMNKIENY